MLLGTVPAFLHLFQDQKHTKLQFWCSLLGLRKKAILLKIKHILLDNMDIKKIKEACKLIGKRAKIEVSGGVNLQNIKKISNIGVNFISVGSITQSASAVKICLELKKI